MASHTPQPALDHVMSVLRHSHDHLVQVVGALTDEQVKSRSYDTEWSIAQVLSHMGSGAEIFTMFVDAGLQGAGALGTEVFPPVWDRWNAKAPGQQARDALAVDAAFLDQIDALSSDERENWHLTMFGADRSLREVAGMRAREHALHTWDVAVAIKPDATVLPDAVELLIDDLGDLVARAGKPLDKHVQVNVTTRNPDRNFELVIDPGGVTLSVSDPVHVDAGPALALSAEAFVRLVAGRLDAGHTPALTTTGIDIDTLRQVFPGF